jgi:prefoldin subunit 5
LAQRGKSEEELRRLSVEMRYLEQTAETLQQRISMVNAALTDLTYANMTCRRIRGKNHAGSKSNPERTVG